MARPSIGTSKNFRGQIYAGEELFFTLSRELTLRMCEPQFLPAEYLHFMVRRWSILRKPRTILPLIGVALSGVILSSCFSSTSMPAPTLVESSHNGAALIRWVASGTNLSGSYDSVYSQYGHDAFSTGRTECAIKGVTNGSSVTVTLTACNHTNNDGTYSGQLSGSHLTIAFLSQSGAIRKISFVPGTLRTFARAVGSTHLLVLQENARYSWVVDSPPSDPCGPLKVSSLFETPEGAEMIVFRNTNSICTNAHFQAEFDIMRWFKFTDSWDIITFFHYDEIGAPQSYAPIKLGPGISAIKIKEQTMLGPAYQVLADIQDRWQFIPFDAPGVSSQGQANDIASGATSITSALTVVEHYRVCGEATCANRRATLHFNRAKMAFVP
jgi:hypothetical protein